jgi:hypothetical protein
MKKRAGMIIVLLLVFCVSSFGFAAWTADLNVRGSVTGVRASEKDGSVRWTDMALNETTARGFRWANASVSAGDISVDGLTLTIPDFVLEYPGAGAKFTLMAANDGAADIKLTGVTQEPGFNATGDLIFEVYGFAADGSEVLETGKAKMFDFYVMWAADSAADEIEATDVSLALTYELVNPTAATAGETFTDTDLWFVDTVVLAGP